MFTCPPLLAYSMGDRKVQVPSRVSPDIELLCSGRCNRRKRKCFCSRPRLEAESSRPRTIKNIIQMSIVTKRMRASVFPVTTKEFPTKLFSSVKTYSQLKFIPSNIIEPLMLL